MNYPTIIGHRGVRVGAVENTFEAYEMAIEQKADMIELDVHLSKDGYIVIYHDFKIPYEGKKVAIADSTLEELHQIRFSNGETLPLLSDVLENIFPRIPLNIEIKSHVTKKKFDDFLVESGCDTSKILVSSFKTSVMNELKNSTLDYSLAFLYIFPSLKIVKYASKDYISAINPYYLFQNKCLVNYLHNKGKKVYSYTVNGEKNVKRIVEMGTDGIFTDEPLVTRNIIDNLLKNKHE